jgi:hypothetical protein
MRAARFWILPVTVWLVHLLILSTVAHAQFGGVDVPVDPDPAADQNEISLTLVPGTVPGQPQVLLAAYNDEPYFPGNGVGVSYSTDGGATWSNAQLPFPTSLISGLQLADAFDPTVTADTQGNLFVGHISTDGAFPGVSGLYVRRSTDGGLTWSAEVEISGDPASGGPFPDPAYRFNDRCQITADRFSASQYTDNVYIAWIRDRGWYTCSTPPPSGSPGADIWFSRSTDNGVTFSSRVQVNDPNQDLNNMPIPRVAADGTVWVSWLEYDLCLPQTQGTIWLDKSTDGGQNWGADQFVATINLPPLNVTAADGTPDARAKGAPVLATSPTDPNELYLVYAADPDGPLPDEADIYLIRSTDQGATWSSPLRLHTDTTTNDQILPWIDVKPNGTIDVAWYDRQNDFGHPLADRLWDVFLAQSNDGGQSFLTEVQLSDNKFMSPSTAVGPWLGEYLGLAVDSSYAYVAWASSLVDSRGDIEFDKIANATTPPPAGNCPSTPATCTPLPGKAILLVKDKDADGAGPKDKVIFKWLKGSTAVAGTAFGDPTDGSGGDLSLCWYENSSLLMEMNVADGHANWFPIKDGFKYLDKDTTLESDGCKKVILKGHATPGRPKAIVLGKDSNLPITSGLVPRPSTAATFDVQLQMSDNSNCFGATFTGPGEVLVNKGVPGKIGLFKAKTP